MPADKQAKCKARRQRQRERAKAKKKELQKGGGGPPTLFVRAFNGDLDRRELTKLAEATLGEGAVTKVRAVGAPGKAASAYVELREGSVVSTSAQKLHKKQLPGGAQLSVKPALDKKGLEAVVKKGAKRKAEPSAKAEGKARRAVLKKKAGKETPAHSKLAKKGCRFRSRSSIIIVRGGRAHLRAASHPPRDTRRQHAHAVSFHTVAAPHRPRQT